MMIVLVYLLIILTILSIANGFFFSKKKVETIEDPKEYVPQSTVKGVPPQLEQSYLNIESFKCLTSLQDQSQKSLPLSSINDGFCDCLDGSDEPGTSACNTGKFYCINKGYKQQIIPSSRVDDGICDCCDGSDEQYGPRLCRNSCDDLARIEKEKIDKLSKSYNIGKLIRLEKENYLRVQLQSKSDSFDRHEKDLALVIAELQTTQTERDTISTQLKQILSDLQVSSLESVWNVIGLNNSTDNEMASFVSSLIGILDLEESDVRNIAGKPNLESNDHHEIEHNDDEISHHEHQEEENADESNEPPPEVLDIIEPIDENSLTTDCPLFQIEYNSKLRPLCDGDRTRETIRDFLLNRLFKQRRPYRQIQLMIGYYKLHKSYIGSKEFIQGLLGSNQDLDVSTSCPFIVTDAASGSMISDEICSNISSIASVLENAYHILDKSFDEYDSNQALSVNYHRLVGQINELENKKNELQILYNESKDAKEHLLSPDLALLSLKEEKFTHSNGLYTYSVQFFDKASQSEENGGEVTLGNHELYEIEETTGDIIWKFKDGQYCWNFGPRTADVRMSCGQSNNVISVREPSTCYYSFEFESPLACTSKFAQINGLTV